ncbi:DUF4145 domain-containing protein [Bacillus sp. ISL-7]|uniref:DUF4145 domain-containing protein n=1 Tax=Bacillus sp. ISL-7 TaxID=2819136 RepID=UPI001BEC18B8|nr:DUF4145 domain-containing protein [Bacillus sp. ISL-7]MBT2735151.1 DUF4145 domain-containing protein [Bacillus sp. ISL-7]
MEEKVLTCFHCGNKTSMKEVAKHRIIDKEEIWSYPHDPFGPAYFAEFGKAWYLFLCPVCVEVTLDKHSWCSEDAEPGGNTIIYEEILYPATSINEHYLPKGVKDAFDAALKVRNLDGAICVLALRRALEKMCKDKGAVGRDLFSKLKDLQEKKILPEIINDVSTILRKEGNSAAHADDIEFDGETVGLMIEFTRTILDYVYTLPEKIKIAQERIMKHETEIEEEQKA